MLLLHPTVFFWDLAILLVISFGLCVGILCNHSLKTKGRRLWQRMILKTIGLIGVFGAILTIYGSFIEPHIIVTTHHEIDLPLQQELKIVILADFHIGRTKGVKFMERAVDHVNRHVPDIVLMPGDFIFDADTDLNHLKPLGGINASLGTYAVLGNHDEGRFKTLFGSDYEQIDRGDEVDAYLRSIGIRLLRNEHNILRIGEERLALAGIDDIWTGHSDLARAMHDLPETLPLILLSHNPSVIKDGQANRAHLIVSGHTHGGQVRLPFIGPLATMPISIDQSYDQGMFDLEAGNKLLITRGIGESTARPRLFAWPEVIVLKTK